MMIDTVTLRHQALLPPPSHLLGRGFTPLCGHLSPEYAQRWKLNQPGDGGTRPRLTWSSTPSGPWLSAEVSLPKLLYGDNLAAIEPYEIQRGLGEVSRLVSGTAGVAFDAPSALVGRVDYFWDFPVGEAEVPRHIDAAGHAAVPRMLRHQIGATTVSFSTQSKRQKSTKRITLYGKHEEVLARAREGRASDDELRSSVGLLRLEVSYRGDGCRRLADRYGTPGHLATYLLRDDIALNELTLALEALGLDKSTEPKDARIDALREIYGDTQHCRTLISFLAYLDRYGEGFWKHGIGFKRSAYYEYARELKKAGLWLRSDQPLPPLRLVRQVAPALAPRGQGRAVRPMSKTISPSPPPPDFPRLNLVSGGGRV